MSRFEVKLIWQRGVWILGFFIVLVSWTLGGQALATTYYVSDTTLEANLRAGTGIEYRIIALVRPGASVTLLGEKDGWAQVALRDGRTGWIFKRYLSERPPWRLTAQKLAEKNQELESRVGTIEQSQRVLQQENNRLRKKLNVEHQELQGVRQEYETLKKGAANYLELKTAYENLTSEAQQRKDQLEKVQEAYEHLKLSTSLRWFLSGAGVLILGWLLGLSMGRMRKRPVDAYRL
ncbi:MAG: TIGR04211 family SH3 domain-containing protein [Deltaproteobacteria bacterium]|nr:MAG: TIGR04211 family SH3 domain-containing protein [Deltaproteobacteria bacterium]